MRIEVDANGYLFVVMPSGEKRYILADVPNCAQYGKLKLEELTEVHISWSKRDGKWVDVTIAQWDDLSVASMRCNQCNRYHNEVYHYGDPTEKANFCPFCGARMKEQK